MSGRDEYHRLHTDHLRFPEPSDEDCRAAALCIVEIVGDVAEARLLMDALGLTGRLS